VNAIYLDGSNFWPNLYKYTVTKKHAAIKYLYNANVNEPCKNTQLRPIERNYIRVYEKIYRI